MAGVVELIWVVGEAEYFSGKDWTTQITLIANENFVSARTVCTVQWGAQPWVPALRRSAEGAPHRVRDTIGGAFAHWIFSRAKIMWLVGSHVRNLCSMWDLPGRGDQRSEQEVKCTPKK